MNRWKTRHSWLVGLAGCLGLVLASCQTVGLHCTDHDGCADHAKVCSTPTVRALAHDLDELERHIEKYGSVVTKQPDVWGQARLTKHREQFEQQMAAELGNFTFTLQGSSARSDQAYFADAFALSAAAGASSGGGSAPAAPVVSSSAAAGPAAPAPKAAGPPAPSKSPTAPNQPAQLPDQSDTFAGFAVARTDLTKTTGPAYAFQGNGGINVEPAVFLDEKARYLNHLNELRRINEGDDTADSPGYALNLVRIPVSILPGKCTDVGHGAEVTATLTPYLSDELLPTTFRNLVLNDLVDQIGFPVTQFINNPQNQVYFDDRSATDLDELLEFTESHTMEQLVDDQPVGTVKTLRRLRCTLSLQQVFARPEWVWVDTVLAFHDEKPNLAKPPEELPPPLPKIKIGEIQKTEKGTSQGAAAPTQALPRIGDIQKTDKASRTPAMQRIFKSYETASRLKAATIHVIQGPVALPTSKARRAQLPFPSSQILDVYGYDFAFHLATDAYRGLAKERVAKPFVDSDQVFLHLPDVQGYLQEQVSAAYKLLSTYAAAHELWGFCTPQLAEAIRAHQDGYVRDARAKFKEALLRMSVKESATHATSAALAWAIIVESALLTEQLVRDMKESAAARGCPCPHEGWLDYYSPTPSAEARQAFNDYVRCRWPIHVFALDPVTQQQNISDTFSSRREMQLAMSLAFVSGQLSAQNMMRYARRIELDFATIDLNGTQVGFSHGDDTFGWRFYPRFQTPDIEPNSTVFVRDLMIGGPSRNALLRQRRLEPGMRECTAVVIMPSFVPYATLNVSSNWFSLTNPKHKVMNSGDAMRLSKTVRSIEKGAPNIIDANCYRDGDLGRLMHKAKQLSARLPLQSTQVQIPYENTLGGFAMFNTGVTDLAPELTGWYGSPSIDPDRPTTLFLVGNHFSIQQTHVIAGGQEVDAKSRELLSRQVMKVVIPANPILLGDAAAKFVDVQVGTPYGVTQHLLIPASKPAVPAAPAPAAKVQPTDVAWAPGTLTVNFAYGTPGIVSAGTATSKGSLSIAKGNVDPTAYPKLDVTLAFDISLNVDPIALTGIPYVAAQDAYIVPVDTLLTSLFKTFGAKFGPDAKNAPKDLTIAAAALKFNPAMGSAPLTGTISNTLAIHWMLSAAPVTPSPPAKTAQPMPAVPPAAAAK